jgi:hypothetical protein
MLNASETTLKGEGDPYFHSARNYVGRAGGSYWRRTSS